MEPKKEDQAASAILELVDGPKDMRFALTAKTLARKRTQGLEAMNELTAMNVQKVTRFRKDGVEDLEKEIGRLSVNEKDGNGGGSRNGNGEGKGRGKGNGKGRQSK